jgi:hypothetical protein
MIDLNKISKLVYHYNDFNVLRTKEIALFAEELQ